MFAITWEKIFLKVLPKSICKLIYDEMYLKLRYKSRMLKPLNLIDPKTFNEKLQWLKLYDRNFKYINMVDKYKVREYIKEKIGEEYLIPLLGVYDKFEDINFEKLPEQFVIKCNHDCGGLVICKNKNELNKKEAEKKINRCLKRNYYYSGREWPYKNVKPKIIIEKYMKDETGELVDYKVHNFNGKAKIILVCRDRFKKTGLTEDFYSDTWEHLNIKRPAHPNSINKIPKPEKLGEMLELSMKLSKDIPFVRTDFYIINNKVYFGEITFYPASGFSAFEPEEWDYKLGRWLDLSEIKGK